MGIPGGRFTSQFPIGAVLSTKNGGLLDQDQATESQHFPPEQTGFVFVRKDGLPPLKILGKFGHEGSPERCAELRFDLFKAT